MSAHATARWGRSKNRVARASLCAGILAVACGRAGFESVMGADGRSPGDGGLTPVCDEGPVGGVCMCGDRVTTDGYCCLGWAQSEACEEITTCSDGRRNQGEVDVDCGGPCAACDGGRRVFFIDAALGDDSTGDGSAGSPWKTLAYACTRVSTPNDIIHVNPGTYVETGRCALAVGVSVEGEGPASRVTHTATVQGESIIVATSPAGTDGNQHISALALDGDSRAVAQAVTVRGRSNVSVHHCTFVDFEILAVIMASYEVPDFAEPTIWARDNRLAYNTVTNSAGLLWGANPVGAFHLGGQERLRVHNNVITQLGRAPGENGIAIDANEDMGYLRDSWIYRNILRTDDTTIIDNAVRLDYASGVEIFDNTITGSLNSYTHFKGAALYSLHVHDNTFGPETFHADYHYGLSLWGDSDAVLVERNRFRNTSDGVFFWVSDAGRVSDVTIRYNVFASQGTANERYFSAIRATTAAGYVINNLRIYNNVFQASPALAPWSGIAIADHAPSTEIWILNNIFVGFYIAGVDLRDASDIDGLRIENNLFFGNGNDDLPLVTGTATRYVNNDNPIGDPLFVSESDFRLRTGSPAIGAGLFVADGEVDFDHVLVANPPNIGAFDSRP